MLHFERVESNVGTPNKSFLFLHGILGSGGNLRSIARRLVAADSSWSVVLVDLRGHGKSPVGEAPHTLLGCVGDLEALGGTLAYPARGILGHSFGGKVALAYAGTHRAELERLVVVDSMPGARRGGLGSEGTLSVIEALKRVDAFYATRDSFIDALVKQGVERTTAMWLAMSLKREPEGLRMTFDMKVIDALLDDYLEVDLWSVLSLGTRFNTQVIIGEKSNVFTEEDRARCRALEVDSKVEVVTLPAGHSVHVDDADGLVNALANPAKEPS